MVPLPNSGVVKTLMAAIFLQAICRLRVIRYER